MIIIKSIFKSILRFPAPFLLPFVIFQQFLGAQFKIVDFSGIQTQIIVHRRGAHWPLDLSTTWLAYKLILSKYSLNMPMRVSILWYCMWILLYAMLILYIFTYTLVVGARLKHTTLQALGKCTAHKATKA